MVLSHIQKLGFSVNTVNSSLNTHQRLVLTGQSGCPGTKMTKVFSVHIPSGGTDSTQAGVMHQEGLSLILVAPCWPAKS